LKDSGLRPDIVFFTHYFPPEGNAPASRTFEHCARWVKDGQRITVVTGVPNVPNGIVYPGYRNRLWPQREQVEGIDVLRVWTYVAPNAGGLKRILNYLSYFISATIAYFILCRRPKLIMATSPQFFCGWTGVVCAVLTWNRFLLEIRDIWPESITTVGAMKKGIAIRFLEVLEKWMYQSASWIVAVGEGYKQKIIARAPTTTSRISVITNGVDLEQFRPEEKDPDFQARWGLNGKFVCAYVGTIGMAHGLDIVLRAASLAKARQGSSIKYLLVGDGAEKSRLQALSQAQGLSDWIVFTGRLPKGEMSQVLSNSDCLLVHLKKSELFESVIPSKIFEAMAVGKPILMAVRGEAAEIVQASGSGLDLQPESEQELDAAVQRLSSDRCFYQSLCDKGRLFVEEHYSRDVLADRYLKLIRQLQA
jgi:glycosyltransferase involved in cell wall biosynthesis